MTLLIGGELVEGAGGALEVEEPARGEVFATVPLPSEEQVDAAIGAARAAARGWAAMPSGERAELLHEVATRIRAKTSVWFNDPLTDNDAGPFGGFKQSGLGRELGQEGLEAFQETKHVHIESELERKDWWYPYG